MYHMTRLCDLSHFDPVKNLERLYLGMNRIQDYSELEKLGCLSYLIELSIISNPVSLPLSLSPSLPPSLSYMYMYILYTLSSPSLSLLIPDLQKDAAQVTANI